MRRFSCEILLQYDEQESILVFENCLMNLGFEPKYMDVFFDEFTTRKSDISFDEIYLSSLIKDAQKPGVITIKENLYEEPGLYRWFRFRYNIDSDEETAIGATYLLEWSSYDLDFIIKTGFFQDLLGKRKLIYCLCHDQNDAMDQSNKMINKFDDTPLPKSVKTIKNEFGEKVIDTSRNWGRMEQVRDLTFMAAPLMWFGGQYYKIIPKEKFNKFKYAQNLQVIDNNLTHVCLFDLNDLPSYEVNRLKQKEYWSFFDIVKVAKDYESKNEVDPIEWLKQRANKKKRS